MDLRKGQPVEYLGKDQWPTEVDKEFLGRTGVLYHGHPGRIWFTDRPHVMVNWVGLEDDPESFAVGYSPSGPDHMTYMGLGVLTEDEYQFREKALKQLLTGAHRSASPTPSWNLIDGL